MTSSGHTSQDQSGNLLSRSALADVLRAKELSAQKGIARKDTSVILLWLDGGPGHMDMYDMKPEAPSEYRGIWNPIRTNVPGIEITELFPLQAKVADKFSIVRSFQSRNGGHEYVSVTTANNPLKEYHHEAWRFAIDRSGSGSFGVQIQHDNGA